FIGPLPVNALDGFTLIFIIASAIRWYWGNRQLPAKPFQWLVAVVAVAATIGVIVAPDFWLAVGFWKSYFILPLLMFLAVSYEFHQPTTVQWGLRGLWLAALYISLLAVVQKLTGGYLVPTDYWLGGEGGRVTSIYSYANAVGLFVAPIAVLAAGYAGWLLHAWRKHRDRWTNQQWFDLVLSVATAVLGVAAVWWAKSDGAIVGITAGIVVMGLYHQKTRIVTAIVVALVAIVIFSGNVPAAWQQKVTFTDWSGQVRLTTWQETRQLIKDHWLLGVGLGGYPKALVAYHQATYLEIFWYPHNWLLNFWVELGLLGVVGMIGGLAQAVVTAWRRRYYAPWIIPVLGALTVIVVHGLVDVPYFKGDLAILWWLLFALLIAPAHYPHQS
ncbi:MAG: O-antigen ligase family protein, partial [Patescibacteria group bacterium]